MFTKCIVVLCFLQCSQSSHIKRSLFSVSPDALLKRMKSYSSKLKLWDSITHSKSVAQDTIKPLKSSTKGEYSEQTLLQYMFSIFFNTTMFTLVLASTVRTLKLVSTAH